MDFQAASRNSQLSLSRLLVLNHFDLFSARPFLALANVVAYRLAFSQFFKPRICQLRAVKEQVLSVGLLDKTKPFVN